MIFGIACGICAILLIAMLILSWADLLVVSAPKYQRQAIELSKCEGELSRAKLDNQFLEDEIRGNLRENWGSVED